MRNSLIYILISLMVVSLIGIIWIQTSWINDAIQEREKDFKVRVNEALNAVNESIDSEEVELFLKREYGNIDSLVNEIVLLPHTGGHSVVEINVKKDDSNKVLNQHETMVIHASAEHEGKHMAIMQDSVHINELIISEEFQSDSSDAIVWEERYEMGNRFDSVLQDSEELVQHKQRVQSMMQRFTFETLMTDEIEDRVKPKNLEQKLSKALKKEGVFGEFSYAVKNEKSGRYESDYVSSKFDTSKVEDAYTKQLFQSDRRNRMNYTLMVQPEDSSGFVWSQVWKMTVLSGVFTLLILLSFGYALYFIFKQKKVSEVKNDFINNMTHELKTPLASISLAAASIKHPEILKKPEEVRRLVGLIEDEKNRINSHVERVLDTAALEAGELKLSMKPFKISDAIQQASKNIELSLINVGGTIEMDLDETQNVNGDAFHLTNVFTNVLDNGIKYRSDVAPKLFVKVEDVAGMVKIDIGDNGIGMTPKQQKHAFDKFYRAEGGDVHNIKGFGLGLSYVKSVIDKHYGTVTVQSKLKEGTTVTIQIPQYGN